VWAYIALTSHPLVTYDGTSFTPKDLTIDLGETVTFTNRSGEAFWPASNLHPSHLIWSDFDPKKPIAPGDSWSFTFTKPGIWGYHDHVKPTIVGTIRVRDQNGADPVLDCTSPGNKQQCWENDIQTALDTKGVDGALDLLASLFTSEPGFREACHDTTHIIGKRAYEEFETGEDLHLSDKTTYCGYGFFHGFIETLLARSGDITQARRFCFFAESELQGTNSSVWDVCFHGIGHGAFYSVAGGSQDGDAYAMAETAIALCRKVASDMNQLHQCTNGVFNALADAVIAGEYGLAIDRAHPYAICARVAPDARTGCYEQMNPFVGLYAAGDIAKGIPLVLEVPEEYQETAMGNAIGSLVHEDMDENDYAYARKTCATLPENLYAKCISGFVLKLMQFGEFGKEYERGIGFCDTPELAGPVRQSCFSTVAAFGEYMYPIGRVRGEICPRIAPYADTAAIQQCAAPAA
jgi:hypothetical protein